jgi:YHS domain-containing protein
VENKVKEISHQEHKASTAASLKPVEHQAHDHAAPDTPRIDKAHENVTHNSQQVDNSQEQPVQNPLQVDPVCGEKVDPNEAEAAGNTSVHDGTTYYFCSDSCRQEFDKHASRIMEQIEEESPPQDRMTSPALSMESHTNGALRRVTENAVY